jgi:hypothetical protein
MQLFTFGVKNTQTFVSWKRLKENSLNDKHISKLVSLKFYPVATLEWLKRFRSFNLRKVGKNASPELEELKWDRETERVRSHHSMMRTWGIFFTSDHLHITEHFSFSSFSLFVYLTISLYTSIFFFHFQYFLCPQFILFFFLLLYLFLSNFKLPFYLCNSFFLTFTSSLFV